MPGNRLGDRKKYIYETEQPGHGFIVETDESLAIVGTGVGNTAPDLYDPANPPVGIELCPPPKRFKPRVAFVQAADGARKSLICFSNTASLYARITATTCTIDGEAGWVVTGHRGEKLTY